MSQFILILFWFAFMALFAHFVDVEDRIVVNGTRIKTVKLWYAILVFVPIVYMAVYRDAFWQDTGIYITEFKRFPSSINGFLSALDAVKKDKAFFALGMLIKIFISDDYHTLFFILAILQSACLIKTFREQSVNFLLSVFIFWVSTDCVSWMFNGIRQFTAVCICLLATNWMLNKKYISAIITIIIASQFHQSSLLMIPIFLVASGKLANYKTVLMIFAVALAVLYVDRFTGLLDTMLEDTQYMNVVDDWTTGQDNGTNPIRVLVYSVPTILMLFGMRHIKAEKNPMVTFSANMSIVSTSLYVVSMFTSGIYMGRLPIYASIYATCILLPWQIEQLFNRASAQLMKIFLFVGYLLFYYYQMHIIWGLF